MNFTRTGAPRGEKTAFQARLDAIASPTAGFFRSFVRWVNRMHSDPETFDRAALLERLEALGPEVAALRERLRTPPVEWSGTEWTVQHERLRRWEGQLEAIEMVLRSRETVARAAAPPRQPERRIALGGCGLARGSMPSTTTADPAWDPFAEE